MGSTQIEESDREDGEIIEDEFEDISDNSITATGRCISPKDHLPDISLSSISDTEEVEKLKRRYHAPRPKKTHRKRKYSHRKSICTDSDSDDYIHLDRKLLRAAIHIDNPESFRNSLHSRLKAMTDSEDILSQKHVKDEPLSQTNSKNMSSDEGDDDLIQLRLEALRTAVLNKFKHRKKRECKEICVSDDFEDMFSDISVKVDDKENAIVSNNEIIVNQIKTNTLFISPENQVNDFSNNQNVASQEEDEDVLRALLLASLSKKISKGNSVDNLNLHPPTKIQEVTTLRKQVPQNNGKIVSTNSFNTFSIRNKKKNPLLHSKVQPIIININCDSDTDDEIQKKKIVSQKKSNVTIENSVEKFLKEQRAKVEAENSDSHKPDLFNKSSLKLLPKIKQIEYHNLLKKLQDAQKLKQTQKMRSSFSQNKLQSNFSQPLKYEKPIKFKFNNKRSQYSTSEIVPEHSEEIPDLRNEVRILHKVLKEIQTQKSKRLQMQSKYTALTPIVKKINEASVERKKYDKDIERILKELTETRHRLRETHLNIAAYVKELVTKKEDIDKKSMTKSELILNIEDAQFRYKDRQTTNLSELGVSDVNMDGKLLDIKTEDNMINATENPDVINKNYSQAKGIISKYVSPLDNIGRVDSDDPFLIMCPYDIDGNCKDPDCIYKHYRE